MKLIYTPISPFARKVRASALELGLDLQLQAIDPWQAGNGALAVNHPALKVPVLIDGDFTLTESTLICLYLTEQAPSVPLVPAPSAARWDVLRRTALTDALMEATVAIVVEKLRRPAPLQSTDWIERQDLKIGLSLGRLASDILCDPDQPDLAGISLACALGYLDFRRPEAAWRDRHPHLAPWYATWYERSSIRHTAPDEAIDQTGR